MPSRATGKSRRHRVPPLDIAPEVWRKRFGLRPPPERRVLRAPSRFTACGCSPALAFYRPSCPGPPFYPHAEVTGTVLRRRTRRGAMLGWSGGGEARTCPAQVGPPLELESRRSRAAEGGRTTPSPPFGRGGAGPRVASGGSYLRESL